MKSDEPIGSINATKYHRILRVEHHKDCIKIFTRSIMVDDEFVEDMFVCTFDDGAMIMHRPRSDSEQFIYDSLCGMVAGGIDVAGFTYDDKIFDPIKQAYSKNFKGFHWGTDMLMAHQAIKLSNKSDEE